MRKLLTVLVFTLFLGLFSSCKQSGPTVSKTGPITVERYEVGGYYYRVVTYKGQEFLQHGESLVKVQ